jgi:hypothetical protein
MNSHVSLAPSRHRWLTRGLLALALTLTLAAGCGPGAGPEETPGGLGVLGGELQGDNGLSTNGLSTNGLSTNGLSTNGLSTNGLSTQGFTTWFHQDTGLASAVMKYVVLCAAPAGQALTFTSPVTGVTYTWTGSLGLAPGWASGLAATQAEQQVVSACLAAHANKYGIHIPISVLGQDVRGLEVPFNAWELSTFSKKEACFFGNLFDGSGLYAANDEAYLNPKESTSRGCGLSSSATNSECPPILHVGLCAQLCERASTGRTVKPYYATCTYKEKTYLPLTTRIRPEDAYQCGDGVCQFTERCGSGNTYDSCQSDCGACPP